MTEAGDQNEEAGDICTETCDAMGEVNEDTGSPGNGSPCSEERWSRGTGGHRRPIIGEYYTLTRTGKNHLKQ